MTGESNPYAAPQVELAADETAPGPLIAFRAENGGLTVGQLAPLSAICLKCGGTSGIELQRWTVLWSWGALLPLPLMLFPVFAACGGVGFLLALVLTSRVGRLQLPLCASCRVRWVRRELVVSVLSAGALVVWLAYAVVSIGDPLGGLPLGALAVVLGFGAWLGRRKLLFTVTRVEPETLTIVGFHPLAEAAILAAARSAVGEAVVLERELPAAPR